MSNYFEDGLSNEDYHKPERGVSCSTIKMASEDPSLIVWSQNAPKDESKMKAIDFGTDFHAYFLEPDDFKKRYKVLPKFNRRKAEEKQQELDLIAEWESDGITAVTQDDLDKLESMRKSAMAHPTVETLMSCGVAERSFFWTDDETQLDCKCRPDWLIADISDEQRPPFIANDVDHVVVDLKTIANIGRIQAQIEDLKYYIQDQFYTNGVSNVIGGNVAFIFVFVSTSLELGRYPVRVVVLSDAAKFDGRNEIEENLRKIKRHKESDRQETCITMDRPHWALNNEDSL